MEKKIIEEPVFEAKQIQVGVNKREVFVTSDGTEFDDQRNAEYHEFYHCKVKQRGINLPIDNVQIFDFYSKGDLEKYENEYVYNGENLMYNKDKMKFPCTYVMWRDCVQGDDYGKNDNWYDYETMLYCVSIEEWKQLMFDKLNELKNKFE